MVLNGFVTAFIAWIPAAPNRAAVDRWILLTDAPTGILILLLAGLYWTDVSTTGGDVLKRRAAAATAFAAIAIGSLILLAGAEPSGFWFQAYVNIPLYLGYAAIVLVLTKRLLRSSQEEALIPWGLLMVGFGMRVAEFAANYGLYGVFFDEWTTFSSAQKVALVAKLVMPAALVVVVLNLVRGGLQRRLPRATEFLILGALGAGFALGLQERLLSSAPSSAAYALTVFSLVIARPICVGLAYEWRPTLRLLIWVPLGYGTYLGLKFLLTLLFERSFFELGLLDLIAATLALATLATAQIARRARDFSKPEGSEQVPVGPGVQRPQTFPTTQPERFIRALLEYERNPADPRGIPQSQLRELLGVDARNMANVIRAAERLLGTEGGGTAPTAAIVVNSANVRGRKFYRFSATGGDAARAYAASRLTNGTARDKAWTPPGHRKPPTDPGGEGSL